MQGYVYVLGLVSLFICGYGSRVMEDVGNPDDTAMIERPCPTYDLNCIRIFFEKHAHCKKTFGPVPDIVTVKNRELPLINSSVAGEPITTTNLNGRVEEFYVNRATNNLVIAVAFTNYTQTSDKTYFLIHRRAREPLVMVATGYTLFRSLTATAIIPNIDDLQLHDAECTTFVDDANPTLIFTPYAGFNTDPSTARTFADFYGNIPTIVQEYFLLESSFLINAYIQYNICDFGLVLA